MRSYGSICVPDQCENTTNYPKRCEKKIKRFETNPFAIHNFFYFVFVFYDRVELLKWFISLSAPYLLPNLFFFRLLFVMYPIRCVFRSFLSSILTIQLAYEDERSQKIKKLLNNDKITVENEIRAQNTKIFFYFAFSSAWSRLNGASINSHKIH